MYGVIFQIEALLKNAWLPPIFFLDTNSFKRHNNIPILVGITHWKPKYFEMRRMYAQ